MCVAVGRVTARLDAGGGLARAVGGEIGLGLAIEERDEERQHHQAGDEQRHEQRKEALAGIGDAHGLQDLDGERVGERADREGQDQQDGRQGSHGSIVAGGDGPRACRWRYPHRSEETGMTTRRVAWRRSDEVETDEHCTLTLRDVGLSLVGTVLGAEDGAPVRIEYRVLADGAGMTTAAHVRDLRGFETRTIALERDAEGQLAGRRGRRAGR